MKDGKSVFVVLALVIFIVYVLRDFLGKISAFFFVPIDRLLFISHGISPVIMWMFFGLLIGIVYGSFIAIKKYRLDYKLLTYPIVTLLVVISMILLVSFIKGEIKSGPYNSDAEGNKSTGLKTSKNLAKFEESLNKGIAAAENEEYRTAEKYFKQAESLGGGDYRLDSLATIYSQTADEKCKSYKRDAQLKYIPNHYYKYAALLTSKLTPKVCK